MYLVRCWAWWGAEAWSRYRWGSAAVPACWDGGGGTGTLAFSHQNYSTEYILVSFLLYNLLIKARQKRVQKIRLTKQKGSAVQKGLRQKMFTCFFSKLLFYIFLFFCFALILFFWINDRYAIYWIKHFTKEGY